MAARPRSEGFAIVSGDGMIANAAGIQPDELKNDADLRFFHGSLDRADVIAHGRHSHEGRPNSAQSRRLILTRRIKNIAPDPSNPKALLWNPAGASFEMAWRNYEGAALLAVIGGTEVFGLFLEIGYDAFHLTKAPRVRLPGGRPVFPGIPERTPEEILAAHGLASGEARVLDAAAGVSLVTWRRT
jgi:hypothetical protein